MTTDEQNNLNLRVDFNELDLKLLELDIIVPFDIYIIRDDDYVVIVKAGTLLDEKLYNALLSHTVYISKNDLGIESLKCKNLDTYIAYSKDDYQYSLKLLYRMNDIFFDSFFQSEDNYFDIEGASAIVRSLMILIKHNKNFLKDNMVSLKNDDIIVHHSLHVTMYALSLGLDLSFNDEELFDLGLSAYLHDVGVRMIDEDIINKESTLSVDELESIHKHPLYSLQIVKHNRIHKPDIINAIKHHHENYDGSGYPDGLRREQITKFAAILSICDAFDAMTSKRPYREKMSSYDALICMMKDENMKHRFNNEYIKRFIKLFS